MQSLNPATGKAIKEYKEFSFKQTEEVLQKTHKAFSGWKTLSFAERGKFFKNAALALRKNAANYAALMTSEMGKPITQAKAEIEKCAWNCEFYAENAEKFLAPETVATDASKSYVRFAPLGTVLAIMPWNFPFWQAFRFAAPVLMAGNTAVLKHASNVSGCSLAIEKVFQDAGFPKDVFRAVLVSSDNIEMLISHAGIRAVALTGSSAAGRSVASLSGKYLKKTVLELGGSDPFIVLDDADIGACALSAVSARILNSGQSCIAAKRFIVLEKIADEFEKTYAEKMENLIIGDPMDPKTEVGPMAREDLMHTLSAQVQESVKKGAKLLTGGAALTDGKFNGGFFYAPTALANVQKGMPAYDEEIFGPVAAIIRVKNVEEAVVVANDTQYGLGASVWTKNSAFGEEIAKQIEAGAVFVNGIVKSDPRLPFGGIKESGYGRELASYGIKEFVNIQSVWVKS